MFKMPATSLRSEKSAVSYAATAIKTIISLAAAEKIICFISNNEVIVEASKYIFKILDRVRFDVTKINDCTCRPFQNDRSTGNSYCSPEWTFVAEGITTSTPVENVLTSATGQMIVKMVANQYVVTAAAFNIFDITHRILRERLRSLLRQDRAIQSNDDWP